MATSDVKEYPIRKVTAGQQPSASNYSVTPLFFQETLEASASQPDNDDSLCFDEADSMDVEGGLESARSGNGGGEAGTSSTFRDTKVSTPKADSLMHGQSLVSITNNPKKESVFKKALNTVKQKVTGKGPPKFKVLTET